MSIHQDGRGVLSYAAGISSTSVVFMQLGVNRSGRWQRQSCLRSSRLQRQVCHLHIPRQMY